MTLDDLLRYRLSRNQRIRAFTLLVISFAGLGAYYLALPKWNEYQEAQTQLADLESRRPVRKHQSSDVIALIEEVKRLDAEAQLKRASYPIAENVSTMLIELEKLTKAQGIEITSFMPTGLSPASASATSSLVMLEQGVEIKAIAKFPGLLKLLGEVEKYHNPLSIKMLEIEPGQSSATPSLDASDPLETRLKLAAFLLEKSPQFPIGGPTYEKWLAEAQTHSGVVKPFRKLVMAPPPEVAQDSVSLPPLPVAVTATPDPIEAWKVEGLLTGPGRVAIVSNGNTTRNLQIGDTLEGWRVQAISDEGATLVRAKRKRTLLFPKPVLPPEEGE